MTNKPTLETILTDFNLSLTEEQRKRLEIEAANRIKRMKKILRRVLKIYKYMEEGKRVEE